MKARSLKVGDDQWARWGAMAEAAGVDRSTYIRKAVDSYAASPGTQTEVPVDLEEAQHQIAVLTAELERVRRDAAMTGKTKVKSTLPGMGRRRYACAECGNLNVQGRCMQHPNAKQKVLEG